MATADSSSKGGAIHWKKLTVQGMQGAMDARGLKSSSFADRENEQKSEENYASKQTVVESGGRELQQKIQQGEVKEKSGDAQRKQTSVESTEPETTTVVLSSAQVKNATEKPNSDLERRQRRAERFGVSVQMSEEEKRRVRAARFGGSLTDASEAKSSGVGVTKVEEEKKRKARAERFGLPVSSTAESEEAKKKARLVRFGLGIEEEKREARAARFGLQLNNSNTDVNKKS